MNITFSLNLPKDEASVPVVRHIFREALIDLGVQPSCVGEIEIATSEACTNVLKHVDGTSDSYDVSVEVNEELCEIRVIDTGTEADHDRLDELGRDEVSLSAEGGRGIFLMRAMVDELRFVSRPEEGTIVHLTKQLELRENSVLKKLVAAPSV